MKYLLKIAIGAAIAAALTSMLMKRRSATLEDDRDVESADMEGRELPSRGTSAGFTVEELIADTSAGRTLNS